MRTFLSSRVPGLCLRCSPYVTQSLGIVVLSAVSGMNSPLKMGPMIALADVAVITKTDLVSQSEKEVFREKTKEVAPGDRYHRDECHTGDRAAVPHAVDRRTCRYHG